MKPNALQPGKGSHTNWVHHLYSGKVTVSVKDSTDANLYQDKEGKRHQEYGTN